MLIFVLVLQPKRLAITDRRYKLTVAFITSNIMRTATFIIQKAPDKLMSGALKNCMAIKSIHTITQN
ncbi:hypothetical protein DXD83_10415 [Ruminococcus bromii]|nr:hypothetical protein DXD83_10415 [Ruminococcus bromii]